MREGQCLPQSPDIPQAMKNSAQSPVVCCESAQGLRGGKRSVSASRPQCRPEQSFNTSCDPDTPTDRRLRRLSVEQLPSPALTKSGCEVKQDPGLFAEFGSLVAKRKARPYESDFIPLKRTLNFWKTSAFDQWLEGLPRSDESGYDNSPKILDDMSRPPSKRSRSTDSLSERLSQSGDGSDTVYSEGKKYSVYNNANYTVVLETKGSFMHSSKSGMVNEDRELCDKLLTAVQTTPTDILFDDDHFGAFHANLRGRSEARICADLHTRIMPSIENLYILGQEKFEGLIEGHNDPWIKSISFHGPRPQPDHTVGFKWSNFSEQQRRKLGIDPTKKSYYTAREDVYFPFLTGEVKCGKHGLDLADRPNTHSMTVTQRGIVDLYRRAKRADDVHRRVLGFSISHDDHGVRLYAHYPEIDGEQTTYWRDTLREFTFGDGKGRERWTCYRFTLNVCELFALPLLERLKSLIDELLDPAAQSFEMTATPEDVSAQGSQNDASVAESHDERSMKLPRSQGLNAELRSLIQGLQQQLEQQSKDSRERENLLLRQLEQQQKESEQQRKVLEQQHKESEQQRKVLEQQCSDLMQMLKEALQKY